MRINHDFHIHTNLSLCAAETVTAEHYINKAKELGLNKIGFANHMWDENIQPFLNRSYKIQTVPYNLELRDELKTLDKQGIKVYFGAEAEFHPIYGVALTEENAEKFDYIIVPNSHTHMTMDKSLYKPYEKHAEFMVEAYEKIIGSAVSRHILAMAHPFDAVCCPYDRQILYKIISDDTYKRLFSATAEKGIAVEINTSCFCGITKDNFEQFGAIRMFRIAREMGCRFTFGSDSHSESGHDDYLHIAGTLIEGLSIKEDDMAETVR